MAVVADRVVVELEAKLDRYNANLKRAERVFNQSTQAQARDIRRLEAQISRSSGAIGSQLRGLAATFAAAFSARQVQELADGYTRFRNALAVAGVEGERFATVQRALFDIGAQYGQDLETLGSLYGRTAQAANELGATQADLINLTRSVAAGLKIQGSSAAESRGALIQLTQALGGEIVRAEEFNSINEGARPILKAVANEIDRYGGSVAALRRDVVEGKVKSKEFFDALVAGTDALEAQASRVNLTIGNSFTVLNNALGVYVGQTDESLSATERISAAIISLSENLDTVVKALGLLSAILLGRFVAGNVAAAASVVGTSTAVTALQLRAMGAVTTMQALAATSRAAGAAMLAAFGGPVGLAVTALAVGIYAVVTASNDAAQASAEYKQRLDQAEQATARVQDVTDRLAVAKGELRAASLDAAEALRQETIQLLENAKAAALNARTKLQARITENNERRARQVNAQTRTGDALASTRQRIFVDGEAELRANIFAAEQEVAEYNKQLKALEDAIAAGPPAIRPGGGNGSGKADKEAEKRRKALADEAARALRVQASVENEIAQLAADRLQTIADLTGTADDIAIAAQARLDADREAFDRQLALDDDLTVAQRAELTAARDAADAEQARAIAIRRRQQLADEALALESAARENEAERVRALGAAFDRTARQRLETERRLIDLQFDEERAQLEGIVASEESTELEKQIAQAKLDRLGELRALAQETARLRNRAPFERYLDEINKTEDEINEELEQIAVDGLENLTDGITDAITGAKSLGEAFSNVADAIIADLIRIAVQQAIIAPLAELLGGGLGGGGGGGFGGFIAGLFGGRASGGHVMGGKVYRVTDGEGFQPAGSGKIIPLGRMRTEQDVAGSAAGPTISMPISVVAPGANEQTVTLIRQTIADAAPTIVQAAQRATMQAMTRKRIT